MADLGKKIQINKNQNLGVVNLLNPVDSSNSNAYDSQDSSNIVWKIMVYDNFCQDVLSTLFKVGNLRGENITLHLNIQNKEREKLHGVKTLYFVQPTQENIDQIIEDIENDLYDYIYINFSYPIESKLFEQMAIRIGKTQQSYKIKSVQQHALNFVSLNQDLFTFNFDHLYRQLFKSQNQVSESTEICKKIAMNLYCVCRQLNTIPKILYRTEIGSHKLICDHLDYIFQQYYFGNENNNNSKQDQQQQQQQFTILLHDRSCDLGSVLLHPWHYGALIHDIMHIKNNKVELNNEITNNKLMTYDLDPQTDSYWARKINTPFPTVLEDTPKEEKLWTQQYNQMGFKQNNQNTSQQEQSENISKSLDEVVEMKERKRKLDMHINIATHLAKELQERELDKFFEIGSAILQNGFLSKQEQLVLFELIENQKLHESDKLRLMILYALHDDQKAKNLSDLIAKSGIKKEQNLKILEFVKKLNPNNKEGSGLGNANVDYVFSLAKQMAKKVNIQKENDPYIIQILKQIDNNSNSQGLIESYKEYFINSPSQKQQQQQQNQQQQYQKKGNQQNMIVFAVQGGGYGEYQAVNEYANKNNKNIIYGGSTIYSAKDLLVELSEIA